MPVSKPDNAKFQNFQNLLTEALTTDIKLLRKEHIRILPKNYILENVSPFHLTRIWNDLPEHIQHDKEVRSRLPCVEHHNRPQDKIHRDGPAPPKYLCRVCRAQ